MTRNYRKEYDNYQGKPEQIKNRAQRNKARADLVKKGVDVAGKDVAHVKALSKGGTNKDGVRVEPASKNRSFKRKSDGSMK
jgi:polyphosphate kinase 2 (PPK2 family)